MRRMGHDRLQSRVDQLLIGDGNGSPWNHPTRSDGKGDNLFLGSILALDPDTGAYEGHYQVNPGESGTSPPPADHARRPRDRREVHKVAMQAAKNGFFYVIDRSNGEMISAEAYAPQKWGSGSISPQGGPSSDPKRGMPTSYLIYPSGIGAHALDADELFAKDRPCLPPGDARVAQLRQRCQPQAHIIAGTPASASWLPRKVFIEGAIALERRAAPAAMNKGMLLRGIR